MEAMALLQQLWPKGIPSRDYELLLKILALLAGTRVDAGAKKREPRRPYSMPTVGASTLARAKAFTAEGKPITRKVLARYLSGSTSHAALILKQLGAVRTGKKGRHTLWQVPQLSSTNGVEAGS